MHPLFCYQVVFQNVADNPVPRLIGHEQLIDVRYRPMQFPSTSVASVIVFSYTADDAITMAELVIHRNASSLGEMTLIGVYPIDGTINREAQI